MTNDATRDALVEKALSDARAGNPYEAFSDENGVWNEGFCVAWEATRAAIEAVGQQPRETAASPDIEQDEYVLPCDVRLPPSTVICAGVKLRTLIDALDYRREAGVVRFREASPTLTEGMSPGAAAIVPAPITQDDLDWAAAELASQDTTTRIVALEAVAKAAREMPRATPAAGHATTEHDFKIPAHAVWALDLALKQLDAEGVEG